MSTATVEENVRAINGRTIERQSRADSVTGQHYHRFLEVDRPEPIERTSYNEATGENVTILEHRDPKLLWDSGPGPGEVMQRIFSGLETGRADQPGVVQFDPREPSPVLSAISRNLKPRGRATAPRQREFLWG
jgi:hypothetical protein